MKVIFLTLSFALTASLTAADAWKILFSGSTVSVAESRASGAAKAIVGEMTVSADAITFEKESETLKCDGAVTIRVAGYVVTTRDCAIQLTPGEKKLFFLSRGELQLSSSGAFPLAPSDLMGRASDRERLIMEFRSRLHSEQAPKPPERNAPTGPAASDSESPLPPGVVIRRKP